MDAVTYTDLTRDLNMYMDKVVQDHDPLIITRQDSESMVLMSINDYNSLLETAYLLSNKANAEHLKKSITQHKSGALLDRELYEDV
jgi:antitoxin YefM